MPDYGFDPTVALGVKPPAPSLNSIDEIGSLAQTQNALLAARTASQTLAARQQAGQIMASAPSLDAGIQTMLSNPATAGFAPDVISTLQSIRSAQVAQQGEQQTQASTGLQSVMQSLLGSMTDPSTFDDLVKTKMATLSPSAQAAVAAALPSLKAALFDNLSGDPSTPEGKTQMLQDFHQRLASMLIGSGMGPDSVFAAAGTVSPQITSVPNPQGGNTSEIVGGLGGSGGVLGQTPTTKQAGEFGGEVDTFKSDMADAAADAQNLVPMAIKFNNLTKALGSFRAGGGADWRTAAGKGIQALKNIGIDIPDDVMNKIANGSLKESEFFNANIKPFALAMLRESAAGSGKWVKSEIDSFLETADATNDPGELLQLINQAKQILQIGYDRSQKFIAFKNGISSGDSKFAPFGMGGFNQWYDGQLDTEKLPQKIGNVDISQTPAGDIKGASSEDADLDAIMKKYGG